MNLGMAVFDPNFDAWMPLGSTVDIQNHTVSADGRPTIA